RVPHSRRSPRKGVWQTRPCAEWRCRGRAYQRGTAANQEETLTTQQPAPVVAGVDGSAHSRAAAALAAWEAARNNRTLRLVSGLEQPLTAGDGTLPPDALLRDAAGALQNDH